MDVSFEISNGSELTAEHPGFLELAAEEQELVARLWATFHLSDYCYNTVNQDDKSPKYLVKCDDDSDDYRFVGFDWQGQTPVTWTRSVTRKKQQPVTVGQYSAGSWDWRKLKDMFSESCSGSHGK